MKVLFLAMLFSFTAHAEKCEFSHDGKSQEIAFTGYKFTNKTGVSGTFKNFKIMAPSKAKSLEELFENSSFWIEEMSLDAGKKARNVNIAKGLLKNVDGLAIRGHVDSVDKKKGTLIANINWGGKNHKVEMKYGLVNNSAFAEGTIDLLEMGFSKGFQALGKLCKVHHKGKDGKVKTWSEVAIRTALGVTKKCN